MVIFRTPKGTAGGTDAYAYTLCLYPMVAATTTKSKKKEMVLQKEERKRCSNILSMVRLKGEKSL